MKKKFVVFVLLCSFFISGSYYESVEKNLKTAEKSGFSSSLSDETSEFLKTIGIDSLSSEKLTELSFKDIFEIIYESLLSKIEEPFKAIFSIAACVIVCSLMQSFCENFPQTDKVVNVITTLSAASVFIIPVKNLIVSSADLIEECSNFMLGFIPVYSSAIIASGNISSATGFRALMLSVSTVISRISKEIIIPLICIYMAMCIVSSISDVNTEDISKSVKSFATWVLSISATVFSGILGLGTLVSSAGDNTFFKTTKFIIGTAVPIVGGTISDALSTVKGCLEITKNILGAYAIIVIAVIFIPSAFELIFWKICLSISSGIGNIFGNKKLSALLTAASSVIGIMLAIVVITAVMFIFSISIMLMIGGT